MDEEKKVDIAEEKKVKKGDGKFKKGQSGNPLGRPKRTKDMRDAMEKIKQLSAEVPDIMSEMLHNGHVSSLAKVRICEIILERVYGKPESSIKITNAQTLEASRLRMAAILESVKIAPAPNPKVLESPVNDVVQEVENNA